MIIRNKTIIRVNFVKYNNKEYKHLSIERASIILYCKKY